MHPVLHKGRKLARRAISRLRNELAWRGASRNAPLVLADSSGFRFTFHPWMRPYAKNLLDRTTTSGQWDAIRQLVAPDDVVFDVGAHAGRFAAHAERFTSTAARIYAFEPVPHTFQMLRENLALNGCTRVIATQAAVSDRDGIATMNLFPPAFSSWNSLGKPVMKTPTGGRLSPAESVSVPAITLDGFCERERISRIDFLKVDVEGFEKSVFEGSRRLLSERRIGRICFEISADPLRGAGVTARDVFDVLSTHGYFVHGFAEASGCFTAPVRDSDAFWANYYASAERLDLVPPATAASAAAA